MNYNYEKNICVEYSDVDSKLELSMFGTVSFLQDIVSDFYSSFKQGNAITKQKYNCVWVYTKIKAKFNRIPKLKEQITASAKTVKVTPVRTETETVFKNEQNEELMIAKHESCVINLEKRKVRKLKDVEFPEDMKIYESDKIDDYTKLNYDFSKEKPVFKQKIYSSDIDFSRHTNNAMYVRHIVSSLPTNFWINNEINEFEIHYISETLEGDDIEVYNKQIGNRIEFLVTSKEREILRAYIVVK